MITGKKILLIVSGGIAAYKSLDLIRRLRERGASVRCLVTKAGAEFVTPLSLQSLSGDKVYSDLFSLTDESEIGHIQLSRDADLLVVAPASADIMARMAAGMANDLATTVLLATDKPVLIAPAMNVRMWQHAATKRNLATLQQDGILVIGPNEGPMACNEFGPGRMSEPAEIIGAIEGIFGRVSRLKGKRAIITSGPTHEAIDPVRYIANRSSGKQGHAIAAALSRLGASCTLVSGPTLVPDPDGVRVVHVENAREMLRAVEKALPADIAVCAAAVADWRIENAGRSKLKKDGKAPPLLKLTENPDILKTLGHLPKRDRPALVVGFAAETDDLIENARRKLASKGCDWIVANDVGVDTGTFGGDANTVRLIASGKSSVEDWPRMSKQEVAERIALRIAEHFDKQPSRSVPNKSRKSRRK